MQEKKQGIFLTINQLKEQTAGRQNQAFRECLSKNKFISL